MVELDDDVKKIWEEFLDMILIQVLKQTSAETAELMTVIEHKQEEAG